MNIATRTLQLSAPFILFSALISGCANTHSGAPESILEPLPKTSSYKRSIQFVSDDTQITKAFQKITGKSFKEMVTFPAGGYSEFRLVVNKSVTPVQSLETKPRLFGYLQKSETAINYNINYALQRSSALTIAEGEVNTVAETEAYIYPNISIDAHLSDKDVETLVLEVMQHVRKEVSTRPFIAEVIGQKDPFHITITGNKQIGLNVGDRFITKTQPISTLELAMFESLASGEQRPVLRLISGPLPTTGKTLAPLLNEEKPIR